MGEIGDTQAAKPLIKALKDINSDVRRSAVNALARIGDKRAVDPLIEALKDKNSTVRLLAARALGEIGDERAIPALKDLLEDQYGQKWRSLPVKSAASHAIECLKYQAKLPQL